MCVQERERQGGGGRPSFSAPLLLRYTPPSLFARPPAPARSLKPSPCRLEAGDQARADLSVASATSAGPWSNGQAVAKRGGARGAPSPTTPRLCGRGRERRHRLSPSLVSPSFAHTHTHHLSLLNKTITTGSAPTTRSGTTPSAATGAARSSASKQTAAEPPPLWEGAFFCAVAIRARSSRERRDLSLSFCSLRFRDDHDHARCGCVKEKPRSVKRKPGVLLFCLASLIGRAAAGSTRRRKSAPPA